VALDLRLDASVVFAPQSLRPLTLIPSMFEAIAMFAVSMTFLGFVTSWTLYPVPASDI
jgi:hypothetical protein